MNQTNSNILENVIINDDEIYHTTLTKEQHAEVHRILYEKYGNEKDKSDWQSLEQQIKKIKMLEQLAKKKK